MLEVVAVLIMVAFVVAVVVMAVDFLQRVSRIIRDVVVGRIIIHLQSISLQSPRIPSLKEIQT
jgi:hypothetical protein